VRPVRIDPLGTTGPTPNQARGPRWRKASPGFYVPIGVDGALPEQRVLERATLLPVGGVVTGWAGLLLAGAAYFDGFGPDGVTPRPVPLLAGPGQSRRPRGGVRWLQDRIEREEVWHPFGVPAARPMRSLFDDMRTADDVRHATVSMDMAAAADVTSIRRMRDYVAARPGWRGVRLVRRALDLSDECSRSPGESRTRLVWTLDTRCGRPVCNRDVFDDRGRFLGVADLIDAAAGVVGEYDGSEHARPRRRSRDAARDSSFRDVGLEVFRVTAFDEHQPGAVRQRIEAAYERARRNRLPRRWTLQPPAGWPAVPTLDQELDTRDVLRELHARAD
jgi:hypothetical protein